MTNANREVLAELSSEQQAAITACAATYFEAALATDLAKVSMGVDSAQLPRRHASAWALLSRTRQEAIELRVVQLLRGSSDAFSQPATDDDGLFMAVVLAVADHLELAL